MNTSNKDETSSLKNQSSSSSSTHEHTHQYNSIASDDNNDIDGSVNQINSMQSTKNRITLILLRFFYTIFSVLILILLYDVITYYRFKSTSKFLITYKVILLIIIDLMLMNKNIYLMMIVIIYHYSVIIIMSFLSLLTTSSLSD